MSVREYGKHAMYSPFLFVIIGLTGSGVICLIMRLIERAKLAYPLAKLGEISLLLLCSHRLLYVIIDDLTKRNNWAESCNWLDKGEYLFLFKIIVAILFAFLLNYAKKAYIHHKTTKQQEN